MKGLSLFLAMLFFLPFLPEHSTRATSANTVAVQAITQLTMHSEPGDYVGAGQDYLYTPADGTFSAQASDLTHDGLADYVVINFFSPSFEFWTLQFGTNNLNSNLALGFYNKAQRAPFASAGHPGLDVGGNGRGCNGDTGKFIILDAKFDYSVSPPQVVSFAAQFEQHCEGNPRALFGTLYYNYTPAVSVSLNQTSVTGGQALIGTITLKDPAPAGGANVTLASSNNALVNIPASVTIPQGGISANFPVMTKALKARPFVQIVATYNGVSNAVSLSVQSPFSSLTQLSLHRDAGDFGGEFNLLLNAGDGVFTPFLNFTENDTPDFSIIFFDGPTDFWTLMFSTHQLGIPLRPGFYPNAQRAPFAELGHPGLDVSGNGSGCNMVTGEFTILDAIFDDTFSPPLIVSFAAQFKQFCEGRPPALTGAIYINYSAQPPSPNFDICLQDDSNGNILRINSATGEYQFTKCGTGITLGGTGSFTNNGHNITLQHYANDRRVLARIESGVNKGTASVQLLSQQTTFTIMDRNMTNNTCSCP